MEKYLLKRTLKEFRGTEKYHVHLFPGKSPLKLSDGCAFVREKMGAWWLFDCILSFQLDKRLKDVSFQIWELKQLKSDLSWKLTCKEDIGKKSLVTQRIEFSDFPLESIKIWVIDKVALLPSEY
jgi:hypothetical protein